MRSPTEWRIPLPLDRNQMNLGGFHFSPSTPPEDVFFISFERD